MLIFDPMGEEEIAQEMGISRPRVSQVITNLLGANIFVKDKQKITERVTAGGQAGVSEVRERG